MQTMVHLMVVHVSWRKSDGEEDDFEGIDSLGRDDFEDEMLPDDVDAETDGMLMMCDS